MVVDARGDITRFGLSPPPFHPRTFESTLTHSCHWGKTSWLASAADLCFWQMAGFNSFGFDFFFVFFAQKSRASHGMP